MKNGICQKNIGISLPNSLKRLLKSCSIHPLLAALVVENFISLYVENLWLSNIVAFA